MNYLMTGAIDDINEDLCRLATATTTLKGLGFEETHPALVAIADKTAKLRIELKNLEADL